MTQFLKNIESKQPTISPNHQFIPFSSQRETITIMNSTAIAKCRSLLLSSLAMTIMLTLMMMFTFAVPPGLEKNYEPTLSPGGQRSKKLWPPSHVIAYYRVTVPHPADSTYFEVTFSACTATPIRIYYSSCVRGEGDCDLYRDHWFPNSTNAHRTHYSIEDPVFGMQQTLSFGRMANNEPNVTTVHYFGVEMEEGPSFADVLVTLQHYNDTTVNRRFTSSPLVDLDPVNKTLSWDTLVYCLKTNSSDPSKCETEFVPEPIEYTVYMMRSDASVNANLATTCGLRLASKHAKVDKLVTREPASELSIASHVQWNGTYLIGVGARDTAETKFYLDYAYRPLNLTVYRAKPKPNTKIHPALVAVPLVVVFVSALLGVAALAGVGIWYKRKAAAEMEILGEFSPLNESPRE